LNACAQRRTTLQRGSSEEVCHADALTDATTFLRDHGRVYVREPEPPLEVRVKAASTAFIAELDYPSGTYHLVLKSTPAKASLRSPSELADVLTRLAASHPCIAESLPEILGVDEHRHIIILAYVEGCEFGSCLREELQQPSKPPNDYEHVLRQAATVLAHVNRLSASDVLPRSGLPRYDSFLPAFETTSSRFASVFRRTGFGDPKGLLARLDDGFFSRVGDRVMFADVGPKNLIVKTTGDPCFIDLHCISAPGALDVAGFLVALDRLGSKFPGKRAQSRLASWQRSFLGAYREHGLDFLGEDLAFFYPWMLLLMFEQHRALHPWAGPYLRWYYGLRLAAFLRALVSLSPEDVRKTPELLFGT
jgi:Ser/Thr protein kinase RdoA (MazF antagonist)